MLKVLADSPSEMLLLSSSGAMPVARRILPSVVLLPVLLVPLWVFVAVPDTHSLVFVPVFLFCAFVAGLLAYLFGLAWGCWSSLEWDRTRAALVATFSGWFLWGRKRLEIPFSMLDELRVEVGPESGHSLPLELHVTYRDTTSRQREVALPIRVRGLNRRKEAMDLAFRIAHILGRGHYAVLRNDVRRLDIQLLFRKSSPAASAAVPYIEVPADYLDDANRYGFDEPPEVISPFQPDQFVVRGDVVPVAEWRPGRRVRIFIPALRTRDALVASAIVAPLPGGMLGYLLLGPVLAARGSSPWLAVLLGSSIVIAGMSIFLRMWFKEREVILDWGTNEAWFRKGMNSRKASLPDVREIKLCGMRRNRTESRGNGRTRRYPVYWCEVRLKFAGFEETLAVTEEYREDADAPFLMLLPMASDLSKSLSIPWRWEEYRRGVLPGWLKIAG